MRHRALATYHDLQRYTGDVLRVRGLNLRRGSVRPPSRPFKRTKQSQNRRCRNIGDGLIP